jgi:hypothetical protein
MDDIAVHTKRETGETEEQHRERHRRKVREMLTILREHNLYLNVDKCQFEQSEVDYLGVWVGKGQVKMKEVKVDKVKDWKPPQDVTQTWRFLGFTGYYCYFIQGYSQLAWPLLNLTKKGMPWHWGDKQQEVFDHVKAKMCQKPILANPDLKKTFYLQTDALTSSVGAVLSQEVDNGKRRPVAYYSCTFSLAEANYNIYKKEFLAVIKAIQNWRAYLIWTEQPFIIKTDHKNLMYWKEPKKLMGWTAWWHKKLQDYNFKIVHVAGKENGPADALSRMHQQSEQSEPKLTSLISPDAFLNVFAPEDPGTLEHKVIQA